MNLPHMRTPNTVRAAVILYAVAIAVGLIGNAVILISSGILKSLPQLSMTIILEIYALSLTFNLAVIYCLIKAYRWARTILLIFFYFSIPTSIYYFYMSITGEVNLMLLRIYTRSTQVLMGYVIFAVFLLNLAVVILLYFKSSSAWFHAVEDDRRMRKNFPRYQ